METGSPSRPNTVAIDSGAFAHNLALVRGLLPSGAEIWQVCKGDGYGLGVLRAAALGVEAGLRDFCVGTPEEALALRAAHPGARILLFPSAQPDDLPGLARSGITLTVHNTASLKAVLERAPAADFLFKVDTGLHRFGFDEAGWPAALRAYRSSGHGGLRGVYTHSSQARSAAGDIGPLALYDRFLAAARACLGAPVPAMAAASPMLLTLPPLPYERADPGRALYGMLPPEAAGGHVLRPVVSAITSRLLDSRRVSPGEAATVGYGGGVQRPVGRVGVMPIGHFDGLAAGGPLGSVLIRGREAPVLARTLLASIIDLTPVPDAEDGDEIVLVGRSGVLERDIFAFAASLATSVTQVHFGLIRNLGKIP